MWRIRAALGDDVDMDAEIRSILGRRASGLNLNLLDRVGDRAHAGRGQQVGRRVDAVEREAVLDFPLARSSEAQTDIAVEAAEHARRRAREVPDVASVQRQIAHRALADRFGEPGAVGVDDRRGTRHDDRLVQLADPHDDVGAGDLVVRNFDAVHLGCLEAAQRDGDLVRARSDELNVVIPVAVGRRLIGIARARVHGDDLGAGNDQAVLIGHRTDERGLRSELRRGIAGEQQAEHQEHRYAPHHHDRVPSCAVRHRAT